MARQGLDETAVSQVEQELEQTGQQVYQDAQNAATEVASLGGGGWVGPAFTSANNVQQGRFIPLANQLRAEIQQLATDLGLGRIDLVTEDQTNSQTLQQVAAGLEGMGRLA